MRVRLIHWNAEEARERAGRLRAAGYVVEHAPPTGNAALARLRKTPPDAVVIDLARLPAQGRDLALWLREATSTRSVPVVFVGGDPQKVAPIRKLLPEATYTPWSRIRSSLKRAIANPPAAAAAQSRMAGYSGTPLVKKLGIKENAVVALVGAPRDFEKTLGRLPGGVTLRRRAGSRADLTVWFAKSARDLEGRIARMTASIGRDGLWIAWPKKASGVVTDLSERLVRRTGLATGLVDYKICAIDATWSGLRFARRAAPAP